MGDVFGSPRETINGLNTCILHDIRSKISESETPPTNGAIELCYVAKSNFATRFIGQGGQGETNSDSIRLHSIVPDRPKSYTDKDGFKVAGGSLVAMTREACCFVVRNGYGRRSSDMAAAGEFVDGALPMAGSVCFDVAHRDVVMPGAPNWYDGIIQHLDARERCFDAKDALVVLRIYVTVASPAASYENESYALAAGPAIHTFFHADDGDPRIFVVGPHAP